MNAIKGWKCLCFMMLGAVLLLPVTAASAQTASGASMPEQAVTTLLEPFYNPAAGSNACNAVSGQLATCPITAGLRQRLEGATENGNIVSRSENPPRGVAITPVKSDGQTAHVATVWDYGASAGSSYSITFIAVKQDGGWFVDDSFCSAEPSSSIYNPPTGPCPLDLRGAPVPGMPNTGEQAFSAFALLGLLGALLMAGAGLSLLLTRDRERE
jgi:LPXTG-motif cell wall-anchored protein